jgi:hypothetical protein
MFLPLATVTFSRIEVGALNVFARQLKRRPRRSRPEHTAPGGGVRLKRLLAAVCVAAVC